MVPVRRGPRHRWLVAGAGIGALVALIVIVLASSGSSGVVLASGVVLVMIGLAGWRISARYVRDDRDA